jgi:DNA invertase Pin-like site-specific DNA recombinase
MMTIGKGKRAAVYLRVSTDDQTTDNQRRELEAVAARHGWGRRRGLRGRRYQWVKNPRQAAGARSHAQRRGPRSVRHRRRVER